MIHLSSGRRGLALAAVALAAAAGAPDVAAQRRPVPGRPAPPARPAPPPTPVTRPAQPGQPAQAAQLPQRVPLPQLAELPRLTIGAPRDMRTKGGWRDGAANLKLAQDPSQVQLRGIDGIRSARVLPQVATDLLVLHARTLAAEEQNTYIVNPVLARRWLEQHPLPPEFVDLVRRAAADDGKKKKTGCSTKHLSTGCLKNEVEQSVDDLTKVWRDAWNDTADELGRLLGHADEVRACFADRRLTLSNIPVRFEVEPQIPLSFATDGKRTSKPGASGSATGTVAVGIPITADFTAQVTMFYIPCLPFAVRPRSLAANGSMQAGGTFTATVNATGQFNHTFTVPPVGGVQIPIAVLPIALGGVPIAVLDISVYLDGTLKVSGEGTLDGSLKMQSLQSSSFAFECSGHSCEFAQHTVPVPATAVESVKLDGRVEVQPAIYSALQLSLNYDLLSARAGPQPFLLGEIYGCAAASGSQSTNGTTSSDKSFALTGDLDWGVDLRAEATAGGQKVAKKEVRLVRRHIYFRDLAQSSALVPEVTGTSQPVVNQAAAYAVKMPTCYPYTDPVDYRLAWTGGASATLGAPAEMGGQGTPIRLPGRIPGRPAGSSTSAACALQAAQGTCSSAPLTSTSLNLAWPAPGDYRLTIVPVGDKHGRRFDPSRAGHIDVRVNP